MKRRAAVLSILATLSAVGLPGCGSSNDDPPPPAPDFKVHEASALTKTDNVVGTGAEAAATSTVKANYSLYLYDPTAPNSKGRLVDGPATLSRSLSTLIPGWQQGVPGMKVGGKRTVVVPSSQAYGAAGSGNVPPGSGVVIDIELLSASVDAPALVKTDTVIGTGTEAVAASIASVVYSLYLYDPTAPGSKGALIEGPTGMTRALSTLIKGWQEGVPGMRVGGKRTLIVPSSLGYGTAGSGLVPGHSGLVFDIELTSIPADAPALVKTDTVIGTGPEALATSTVTVNYSLWLYDPVKADKKGALLEGPLAFTRSLSLMIEGWKQGVPGMKVGGKRTLIVPSSLAYGTTGSGSVPPNIGLVFEIELTGLPGDAASLVKTDTLVGTGEEVLAGKTVNTTYTLWLYDVSKADFKGTKIEGPNTGDFALVAGSVIAGWVQGIPGMKVKGKRTLIVPSTLAYGAAGNGTSIPANAALVFDIEVNSVK